MPQLIVYTRLHTTSWLQKGRGIVKHYHPTFLRLKQTSRTLDSLKGGLLLLGIVAFIVGTYLASDHASTMYRLNEADACATNDVENCPALLLPYGR